MSFRVKQAGEYQVPKIWYRGYEATIEENGIAKKLKCYEKDGFVTLKTLSDTNSVIDVYYKHPTVLIFLDFSCLILWFGVLFKFIKDRKGYMLCKQKQIYLKW